jgi:tetratricopeptide (TPR) repeat protein
MVRKCSGTAVIVLLSLALLVACQGMGPIKAEFKFTSGQYEEAIPLFVDYLKEHPRDAGVMGRLGVAYLKAGKNKIAVKTLEKVLAMKPGDADATLYLGVSYVNLKDFGKALAVWQGYSDPARPLVEAEIKRQMTILKIAESQRLAKKALSRETVTEPSPMGQDTIAVCYFQDDTPDKSLRAFQKGLAAMVISDLAKVKSVKVVERLQLQALLSEMKLGQTGIVDATTAPRVGRLLGASTLVVGDLSLGSIRVNASLASTANQQIQGTTTVTVDQKNFFEISPAIATDVVNMLGIEMSAAEVAAIGTVHTKNFKAFSYFGQALDALDGGDWETAKDFFDQAVREDPAFDLARGGSDSCPGASSPSVSAISTMTATEVSEAVEKSVGSSVADQESASSEAEAEARVNEGGGGGGDGH